MKRLLLSATVLAAAVSGGANASILSISAFGGFIEGSAGSYPPPDLPVPPGAPPGSPEGFPEADAVPADDDSDGTLVDYFGCAGGVCTSFAWGSPTGDGGPFGGKSGASINLGNNPDSESGEDGTFGDDSGNDGTRSPENAPEANSIAWHPNPLGAFLPLGSLTHFNEEINGDPSASVTGENGFVGKVDVDYAITVDKYEDDGTTLIGSATLDDLIFNVVFFETLNSSDPCPTEPEDAGNCGDTFEFFGDTLRKFEIAGQKYTLELLGFCNPSDDIEACRASDGVFYSAEGEATTAFVFEVKEAPVPGVLALFGAGLIGLGFARRRNKKA
jgi:hypothetical protein